MAGQRGLALRKPDCRAGASMNRGNRAGMPKWDPWPVFLRARPALRPAPTHDVDRSPHPARSAADRLLRARGAGATRLGAARGDRAAQRDLGAGRSCAHARPGEPVGPTGGVPDRPRVRPPSPGAQLERDAASAQESSRWASRRAPYRALAALGATAVSSLSSRMSSGPDEADSRTAQPATLVAQHHRWRRRRRRDRRSGWDCARAQRGRPLSCSGQ
jgi:hypothetical protein